MPEKYALYKNSFYSKYCKLLNRRQALTNEKYQDYLNLLQELIGKFITKDQELLDLYESVRPRDGFADKNFLLLGQDMLYRVLDQKVDEVVTPDSFKTRGILIYPDTGKEIDLDYWYDQHLIQIKTVNMNVNWREIEGRLRGVV